MRNLSIILVLALMAFAVIAPPESQAASDEAEIRRLLDNWAKAFARHDLDGVMAMYAEDVVSFDVVPPLQYTGKEAYRKDYAEFMNMYDGPIDIEYRGMKVFVSGDVGFVYVIERIGGKLKGGERTDVWVRCTSGFRKINGKWKDVHDHVSVPADFETGKAAIDLKP